MRKVVCLLVIAAALISVNGQDCEYKNKDYSIFTGAQDWTGTDGSYTYKFNICRATVSTYYGSDCVAGMQSHQLSGTFCTANIAGPTNAEWDDIDDGVKVTYGTGGRICGGTTQSSFVINFLCDEEAPEIPPVSTQFQVAEPSICNYEVTFPTSFACGKGGGGGGGGGGGDDGGLSGGSVFLIIFFVGGFCYLAGGVIYNTKQLGKTGTDAIPNIEFWREFPTYVKDGVSFAIGKCRGTGGSTGQSYSSVP